MGGVGGTCSDNYCLLIAPEHLQYLDTKPKKPVPYQGACNRCLGIENRPEPDPTQLPSPQLSSFQLPVMVTRVTVVTQPGIAAILT